jgi:tRNA 2-selenouridine synthase
MRDAPCAIVQAPTAVRTALLLQHYAHFLRHDTLLAQRLHALTSHYGRATIERWCALAQADRHPELVAELLEQHYDPAYDRSLTRNFVRAGEAQTYRLDCASPAAIRIVAEQILADCAHGQPA